MVAYCCVKNCKNIWIPNSNISYHRFPWNDKRRLEKWFDIPTKGRVSKYSYICSSHFKDSDFDWNSKKRNLRRNAVPIYSENDLLKNTSKPSKMNVLYEKVIKTENEEDCMSAIVKTSLEHNYCSTTLNFEYHIPTTSHSTDDYSTAENFDNVTSITAPSTSSNYLLCENYHLTTEKKDVASQTLSVSSREKAQYQRIIHILRQRLHRREMRLKSITEVAKRLKKQRTYTEQFKTVLSQRFPSFNIAKYLDNKTKKTNQTTNQEEQPTEPRNDRTAIFDELFRNEVDNYCKSKNKYQYSDKMKEFASMIYSYSPKAYEYLRKILHLPHKSNLRKIIGETSRQVRIKPCAET